MADHQRLFLKSTRPSLPLKKVPPLSPSPFPLRVQGMYQPPYSVLKPLRYMVGGPSEVYASSRAAVLCAGMNPPSLKDLLSASAPSTGRAACSQLAGIAVYGNAGTRCCCPLTSRTSGGSDNFFNFFNSYNFYNLTSVTEKM